MRCVCLACLYHGLFVRQFLPLSALQFEHVVVPGTALAVLSFHTCRSTTFVSNHHAHQPALDALMQPKQEPKATLGWPHNAVARKAENAAAAARRSLGSASGTGVNAPTVRSPPVHCASMHSISASARVMPGLCQRQQRVRLHPRMRAYQCT